MHTLRLSKNLLNPRKHVLSLRQNDRFMLKKEHYFQRCQKQKKKDVCLDLRISQFFLNFTFLSKYSIPSAIKIDSFHSKKKSIRSSGACFDFPFFLEFEHWNLYLMQKSSFSFMHEIEDWFQREKIYDEKIRKQKNGAKKQN